MRSRFDWQFSQRINWQLTDTPDSVVNYSPVCCCSLPSFSHCCTPLFLSFQWWLLIGSWDIELANDIISLFLMNKSSVLIEMVHSSHHEPWETEKLKSSFCKRCMCQRHLGYRCQQKKKRIEESRRKEFLVPLDGSWFHLSENLIATSNKRRIVVQQRDAFEETTFKSRFEVVKF